VKVDVLSLASSPAQLARQRGSERPQQVLACAGNSLLAGDIPTNARYHRQANWKTEDQPKRLDDPKASTQRGRNYGLILGSPEFQKK